MNQILTKEPSRNTFSHQIQTTLKQVQIHRLPNYQQIPTPTTEQAQLTQQYKKCGFAFRNTTHQSATQHNITRTKHQRSHKTRKVAHFLSEHYLLDNSWGCNSRFFVAVVATATWKRGRRAGGHNCGQCWQQNIREITRVGQGDSVAVIYRNQWIVNTTKISRDRATVLELTKNNT
jgi:hypothetical protein